jgi:hypothetical protein
MRISLRLAAFVFFALLPLTNNAFGWCYKEHILFTRLAILRLENDPTTPAAMKAWLHDIAGDLPDMGGEEDYFMHTHIGTHPDGMTGISYWAYMPDIHAFNDPPSKKIEPFGVPERLLHYIDLEIFVEGDAKRQYANNLAGKPRLSDIPHDMHDPRYLQSGMLPLRIEYCYQQLVQSIRDGKLNAPTIDEQEGKTSVYWAGYLAHYLGDNTQPQHATIDYKSSVYFANKRKAPNVHGEVEYKMCDDEKNDYMSLRQEYWPIFVKQIDDFHDPVQAKDLFESSVEVSLQSYDALPLIGQAAMQAAGQGGTPDHPQGDITGQFDTEAFFHFRGQYMGREMSVMEMKAIQTAWAVQRIQKIFRQAWDEGTK